MDTQRNSEDVQSDLIISGIQMSRLAGLAGITLYAWSDHWFNNDQGMDEWSFGLLRRDLSEKPVLTALRTLTLSDPLPPNPPSFSVIICTHNGANRLRACLDACRAIDYPDFEIIVVNDLSLIPI